MRYVDGQHKAATAGAYECEDVMYSAQLPRDMAAAIPKPRVEEDDYGCKRAGDTPQPRTWEFRCQDKANKDLCTRIGPMCRRRRVRLVGDSHLQNFASGTKDKVDKRILQGPHGSCVITAGGSYRCKFAEHNIESRMLEAWEKWPDTTPLRWVAMCIYDSTKQEWFLQTGRQWAALGVPGATGNAFGASMNTLQEHWAEIEPSDFLEKDGIHLKDAGLCEWILCIEPWLQPDVLNVVDFSGLNVPTDMWRYPVDRIFALH